jgi:HAD superfamily hydrolase (TIGR01509 family)
MIRALIFDFDGLILDTEVPVYQSWQELYLSHGCDLALDHWLDYVGTNEGYFDPLADLERQLACSLDRETVGEARRKRETELIAQQRAMPGVEEYLSSARRLGLKIAIASSASCKWVTSHLERLGLLERFDNITARDDVTRTKPNPDLFLTALESLEVKAAEAIVFEDSLHGIRAARQAGIYCVAVPNAVTRHLPLNKADFQLNSLADLSLEELLKIVIPQAYSTKSISNSLIDD